MRIDELRLLAVGPFSGKVLDLSSGNQGLHVIFGPNEAGKSSALRALRALLFGFEFRTRDDFKHRMNQLAVGGRLRSADGKQIDFKRLKKNKGSLVDPATEDVLPDDSLSPFLGGLTEQVFGAMFGIDHGRLVQGGEEILEQKGDLGEALFTAASGVNKLRSFLNDLTSQADSLFTARGRSYSIAQVLASIKEAEAAKKQATLTVDEWKKANQRLEDAREALAQISSSRAGLLAEKNRIERWLRLLPRLAQRRSLLEESAGMPLAPDLSEDFPLRWQNALNLSETTREKLSDARQALLDLVAVLEKTVPDQAILAAKERIDDASKKLGAHEKALEDKPRVDSSRRSERNSAREALSRIRPGRSLDSIPEERPGIEQVKSSLGDLISSHSGISLAEKKAQQRLKELSDELAQLQESTLDSLAEADVAPLQRAVQSARKAGDIGRLLAEAERNVTRKERACADGLAALGRWRGPMDRIGALQLPAEATIARHEKELRAKEEALTRKLQRREDAVEQLAATDRELRALALEASIPSEEDLSQARTIRDKGWDLVKRAWLENDEVDAAAAELFPDGQPLHEAYEQSVGRGDGIADRLRREAQKVARRAQLEATRASLEGQLETLETELQKASTERKATEQRWLELWKPAAIDAGTPQEMRSWLTSLEALRDKQRELEEAREKLEQTRGAVVDHTDTLRNLLQGLGADLDERAELHALLQQADEILDSSADRKAAQEKKKQLQRELTRVKDDLARAAQDLATWQEEWAAVMKPLGLPADTKPKVARSTMDSYLEVFAHFDEAEKLEARIKGIEKDEERFLELLGRLTKEVSPGKADETPQQQMARLRRELDEAVKARDDRERQARELAELERRVATLETHLAASEEKVAALCREAGCADKEQVPEVSQRSKEQRTRRDRLKQLDAIILEEGAGADLTAIEAELENANSDALGARSAELPALIQAADAEFSRMAEEKGSAETELRRLSASEAAAGAAARTEEALAQLADEIDRYLPLRAAELLLKREIARFQEENQSPLLKGASAHFSALTGGSFRGVRADYDDKDKPILVGIRSNGDFLLVDALSTGTRDQLYLALRLAAVEAHVARAEPIPFIVDDVLVQFDDDRALAALQVFAGLAKKTQVLLFTHHRRIREMAVSLAKDHEVYPQDIA